MYDHHISRIGNFLGRGSLKKEKINMSHPEFWGGSRFMVLERKDLLG